MAQVDGNTDDKCVQETFISTLVETMKGENFPVFHRDDYDDDGAGDNADTDPRRDITEKRTTSAVAAVAAVATTAGHAVSGPAVPRQNGHLPNDTNEDNKNGGQHLRYDVRNMYSQIGSYANDPSLFNA